MIKEPSVNIVPALGARSLLGRGTVTSRILVFTLTQLGLDEVSIRKRLGAAARSSPFDPYDPALAAEELVRKCAPGTFQANEHDWLRHWDRLHMQGLGPEDAAGPEFWLSRIREVSLKEKLARMRPYRQRCCRRYAVTQAPGFVNWRIEDQGTPVFTQRVADARARVRRFSAPPDALVADHDILQLIATACELVSRAPGKRTRAFEVTAHLMLTHANVDGGKPAPEGMHQDGSNYIVSAIVLERSNVTGGTSVIRLEHADGPPAIDSVELQEGWGIFQADLDGNLWHGVTPVQKADPTVPGFRSILGFDITAQGDSK